MALTSGTDQRFGHLLEPIRDLAENWSIDIAAELEDYLSELESITISFEDGKNLDFAEAALLIQGSACIYSKKVEHLYALVLNVLDEASEQRKKKEKKAREENEEGATPEDEKDEDEDAFTTIEHLYKEAPASQIDLAPDTAEKSRRKSSRAFTRLKPPIALMRGDDDDDGEAIKMNQCTAHAVTGGGGVLRRLGLLPSSAGSPTSVVVPLRAPLWFQFDALHDAASKGRLAARKIRRAEAAQRTHVAAPDVDSVEPEADALRIGQPSSRTSLGGGNATGSAGGAVSGGPANEDYASDDGPMHNDDSGDDEPPAGLEEVLNQNVVSQREEGPPPPHHGFGKQEGRGLFGTDTSSYEEMCRAHVENCLEASSSYQEDYELHRRVAEWQAKVEPLLDDEARRDEFDIIAYADRLLANFDSSERVMPQSAKQRKRVEGSSETSKPFEELAQVSDTYEVCRMFLATLQLTNQGNVNLEADGNVDAGDLTLTVNLLSRDRHPARTD